MNLSAQTKNKLDPRNIIIIACAAVFAVYWLFNFRVFRIPHSDLADCLFIYSATLLPLAAIFAVAAKSLGKSKRLAAVAVLLGASYVLRVLFGGSFFKVIKVYLNQSTAGNAVHNINGMCANLSLPFYHVPKGTPAYYALLALFLCLTAAADSLIIVYALRVCQRTLSEQQAVFLCALLPLVSVFFMPKMLDRFYYLAETFLAVYLSVKRDKDMLAAFCLLETGQWLVYMRAFTPEKFFIMKNAFIVAPLFIAFSLFFAARRYFTEFARTQPNESSEIDKTA